MNASKVETTGKEMPAEEPGMQSPGPATLEMLEWSKRCLERRFILQIPDAVHRAFLEEWNQQ